MTKIASKRFFLWWGFALLICASPLGIIPGVVIGMFFLMVVTYLFLTTRTVCSWISEGNDCWFSLTKTGTSNLDWEAAIGILFAGYILIILYILFHMYRARTHGQMQRFASLARLALNMIFIGCAVSLAWRMTLMASSGM